MPATYKDAHRIGAFTQCLLDQLEDAVSLVQAARDWLDEEFTCLCDSNPILCLSCTADRIDKQFPHTWTLPTLEDYDHEQET